jgi:hypothetical protein
MWDQLLVSAGSAVFTVEDVVLLFVLVGYAAWWSYDLRHGSAFHRPYLVLHVLVYSFFAFWTFDSWIIELAAAGAGGVELVGLGTLTLPVAIVAAAHRGLRYGREKVSVERSETGGWRYRGSAGVTAYWLLLWVVRLIVEDGFLRGFSVFSSAYYARFNPANIVVPAGVSPIEFIWLVSLVELLYLVSFGVMIGFTLGIWSSFRRGRAAAKSSAPT